jgi:hypothetical protein
MAIEPSDSQTSRNSVRQFRVTGRPDQPSLMPLNWNAVRTEHVRHACELVVSGQHPPRAKAKDLFIRYEGQDLPAKHFLRLAPWIESAV